MTHPDARMWDRLFRSIQRKKKRNQLTKTKEDRTPSQLLETYEWEQTTRTIGANGRETRERLLPTRYGQTQSRRDRCHRRGLSAARRNAICHHGQKQGAKPRGTQSSTPSFIRGATLSLDEEGMKSDDSD